MRNNRTAGNNFERTIVKELNALGFDVTTSRNESRKMDAMQVDIMGDIPYHIQCKNSQNKPKYNKLLKEMPDDKIPVVFHRQTHKANERFITDGDYVIMKKEDFYKILNL